MSNNIMNELRKIVKYSLRIKEMRGGAKEAQQNDYNLKIIQHVNNLRSLGYSKSNIKHMFQKGGDQIEDTYDNVMKNLQQTNTATPDLTAIDTAAAKLKTYLDEYKELKKSSEDCAAQKNEVETKCVAKIQDISKKATQKIDELSTGPKSLLQMIQDLDTMSATKV